MIMVVGLPIVAATKIKVDRRKGELRGPYGGSWWEVVRVSIDLLELMHKKAFNRRRLSSPTVSDDYPIVYLKEVQKSRHRDNIGTMHRGN